MKHTKEQRLTFFEFLSRRINNVFLEKILEKHQDNVPLPQRKYINDLVDEIKVEIKEDDINPIALIYCLHVEKVKEGYMDMFVKELLAETEFDLTEENVGRYHKKLQEILEKMNLPKLSLDVVVAKNIASYSDDFRKKFGRLIEDYKR